MPAARRAGLSSCDTTDGFRPIAAAMSLLHMRNGSVGNVGRTPCRGRTLGRLARALGEHPAATMLRLSGG